MLVLHNIIFDFATQYRNEKAEIGNASAFRLDDDTYEHFKKYVLEQDFSYSTESFEKMEALKKIAEDEGLLEDGEAEFEQLLEKFKPSKSRDLGKYKSEIVDLLEDEIVGRYYYLTGRLEHSMEKDEFILKAVEILNDSNRYNQILNKEN